VSPPEGRAGEPLELRSTWQEVVKRAKRTLVGWWWEAGSQREEASSLQTMSSSRRSVLWRVWRRSLAEFGDLIGHLVATLFTRNNNRRASVARKRSIRTTSGDFCETTKDGKER